MGESWSRKMFPVSTNLISFGFPKIKEQWQSTGKADISRPFRRLVYNPHLHIFTSKVYVFVNEYSKKPSDSSKGFQRRLYYFSSKVGINSEKNWNWELANWVKSSGDL
jgi:hypothetical protein